MLDTTLGNLKFANKGTKDPIFGMDTSAVMLNDVIKAFADYSEYLEKSKGSAPVKATDIGKGLLMKEGVEIAVERVSIPKRRRSKTIIEQVAQYEEGADVVDSEMTEEDEEPLVRTKLSGVSIGGEARIESEEEGVDHSQKGSGEGSGITLEVPDELTLKSSNEGASVILEVPDKPSDYSSSSSSDSEFSVEDVSSDEDDATEKPDEAKKAETEKDTDEQLTKEHLTENKLKRILKKSKRPKSQVDVGELDNSVTRLEKKVHATSSFNLPEEIGKSVKAHFKNVIPKDVSDFGKIKMEKAAKKSLPKSSTTPFDQTALYN
ncbi:hypothetical protein Tco_1257863 [Tanacetum coccineum]